MAHVRKTKSGKWKATVEMGRDPATGRRKRRYKTFERKKDAQAWIAKMQTEKNLGIAVDPTGFTVHDYLLKWLQDYAKPNLAPTTYDGYKIIVERHLIPALGAIKLGELKPMHIQSYQTQKLQKGRRDGQAGGLSKKTLLQHHRVLSKALKQAVRWQLIPYNPAEAVPAPSPDKPEIKVLTAKQVEKLLEVAGEGTWIYYLIYLAVNTGMRRGELLGLRWSDVNFREKTIYIRQTLVQTTEGTVFKPPKTKASIRSIEIFDDDVAVLKELKKKQAEYQLFYGPEYNNEYNLVLCYEDGSVPSPYTASEKFSKIAKKAGFPEFTLHDLRHTHASLMLEAGAPMKVIQERLGHSTITTTMDTYSHLMPNMQKEAVKKFKEHMNK